MEKQPASSFPERMNDLFVQNMLEGGLIAKLRQLRIHLAASFWLRPTAMTLAAIALALFLIDIEVKPSAERQGWLAVWLYAGGVAGARDVLGTIAAATITVAGTTFSITVAAFTLASSQMGPRLLQNFRRDPGNQYALGAFLATFAYALTALRSVHEAEVGAFIPQTALLVAMLFAFACVGVLIWFLHHVASSISVDRVIAMVHEDLSAAIAAAPNADAETEATPDGEAQPAVAAAMLIAPTSGGYLSMIDDKAIADWAADKDAVIRLRIRPGDFLFPGSMIGSVWPAESRSAAQDAIKASWVIGETRSGEQDLEFIVRQLVEIGLRALSSGLNDPFTAVVVLDHLGAALCALSKRRLPDGRTIRHGRLRLERPATDYAGLLDVMLHALRQASVKQPVVALRLLQVLDEVAAVERDPGRRAELRRHADLARDAALAEGPDPSVREAVAETYGCLLITLDGAQPPGGETQTGSRRSVAAP